MKKWVWIICVAIIATVSIVAWRQFTYSEHKLDALNLHKTFPVSITQSTLRRAVHALGRLEPKNRLIKIAAPSGNEGNRLESLQVREGDRVSKGTVLGYMDTHSRRLAALGQEESKLETAIAKLAIVQEGSKKGDIEAARAIVESAKSDLDTKTRDRARAEELKRKNAISDAEVDEYRLAHERAIAMLRQTKAQLEAISEVRSVDVALAESEVRLARSSVQLAKTNVEATIIVAPCDGRILRIHAQPGEQIPSDGLLDLGQVDQMQAVAEVFEGDIPHIKLGDHAQVTIDTTGHQFSGVVSELGHIVARKVVLTNDPVSDTDARVVEVRIDLQQLHPEWLSRLSNARLKVRIEPSTDYSLPTSELTTYPQTKTPRASK